MKKRLTHDQRMHIIDLLQQNQDRHTIAEIAGVTAAQVSAIAAHLTMGRYGASPTTAKSKVTEIPKQMSNSISESQGGVLIGFENGSNQPMYWNPNPETGSANPHLLILGESGFGKTYTTICLTQELAALGIGSLVFDYGQGFTGDADTLESKLLSTAERIELGRDGIALNPLEILDSDLHGPASVAQRVADSFARVYSKLGVQQHAILRKAILSLFAKCGISLDDRISWRKRGPELAELEHEITSLTETADPSHRRVATALNSHIASLFLFRVFRRQGRPIAWKTLLNKGITVLSFRGLEARIQLLATEFLLWNCCAYLESQRPRKLHSFLVLDEAHRLNITDGSPVEQLIREARKFGLGVMLASQQPEDFTSVTFANTGTKIVFQISDERSSVARYLYRKSRNLSFSEVFHTITRLPRGWAYVVTENFERVVRIARLDERGTGSPQTRGSLNLEERR